MAQWPGSIANKIDPVVVTQTGISNSGVASLPAKNDNYNYLRRGFKGVGCSVRKRMTSPGKQSSVKKKSCGLAQSIAKRNLVTPKKDMDSDLAEKIKSPASSQGDEVEEPSASVQNKSKTSSLPFKRKNIVFRKKLQKKSDGLSDVDENIEKKDEIEESYQFEL